MIESQINLEEKLEEKETIVMILDSPEIIEEEKPYEYEFEEVEEEPFEPID